MYERIRSEGFDHSRVMEYASVLTDDIGPRLTGSPQLARATAWTRDTLAAMGSANAHLEDWGEFGMGWEQESSSLRMVSPAPAVFIAQAAPWSPATMADGKPGPVRGEAVQMTIDFDKNAPSLDAQTAQYKGKLRGKIVLLGEARGVGEDDKPLSERYSAADLETLKRVPLGPGIETVPYMDLFLRVFPEREKLARFFKDEGVAAVLVPSRDGGSHGGSGGTIFDDFQANGYWFCYQRAHATPVPLLVAAVEADMAGCRGCWPRACARDAGSECRRKVHRRPRTWLQYDRRDTWDRPAIERSGRDGRRAPRLVGQRDGRDRQRCGCGGGDGGDANSAGPA